MTAGVTASPTVLVFSTMLNLLGLVYRILSVTMEHGAETD